MLQTFHHVKANKSSPMKMRVIQTVRGKDDGIVYNPMPHKFRRLPGRRDDFRNMCMNGQVNSVRLVIIIIRQCSVVGQRPQHAASKLACLVPYRVVPVFVQVVSPPLGWSPLSYFLVIWSPSGDKRCPSVVFEAVDMPCLGPFHFSQSVDYIYDFCPLPDQDVGLSILVYIPF